MALNFMGESREKINWKVMNLEISSFRKLMEFSPMPGYGVDGGDAIGISIPQKNMNLKCKNELMKIIPMLHKDFKLELYDMQSGNEINSSNIADLEKYFQK